MAEQEKPIECALRQKQRSQSHVLGSQRKVIAFEMIVEVLAVLKYEGSRTIRFS